MKKLMFFALAAASLALHASVEVLDLKKGLTALEFSTGVRAIERIEAVSYVDNATLTVKRIRGLVDIPYFSHRTNDGEAVDWKILDGTTYDNHPEELLLPLKKRTGGTLTTNTFYTTTMRRGSVVSTNFVNAGYLLPGDRMVVEGTALPTGQVKMYLNTKE